MTTKLFSVLPSDNGGYAFPSGTFNIVIPIARTNLITNPSIERSTTGYSSVSGATLLRSADDQARGAYALRVSPAANTDSGVYFGVSNLKARTAYAFSCDVNLRGGVRFLIAIKDLVGNVIAKKSVIGKGYWERVSVAGSTQGAGDHRCYLQKDNSPDTEIFFTDGWQLEECASGEAYPTTYIDGDQVGFLTRTTNLIEYRWHGAPHASVSSRAGFSRAGGRVVSLNDYGLEVIGFTGLGITSLKNVIVPQPLIGGGAYQETFLDTRGFTIAVKVYGATQAEVRRNVWALENALAPQRSIYDQPLKIIYQQKDECGEGGGQLLEIAAIYEGGLEGAINSLREESIGLKFRMANPAILETFQKGSRLGLAQTITSTSPIIEETTTGVYQDWSIASGTNSGTIIYLLVVSPFNGYIYIAGNFSQIGGISAAGAAYYDGTQWRAMGSGLSYSAGLPRAIFAAPNGDVYYAGEFDSAGGVANTAGIAKWNGSAWVSIGTCGGALPSVRSLDMDEQGNLYAAGFFSTIGGVASPYFAKYDGVSWANVGAGSFNNLCYKVRVAPDGYIYVGGNFTAKGAISASRIIRYDTASGVWEAMGAGTNGEVVGIEYLNGLIYIAGTYTSCGGFTSYGATVWNGASWANLGGGFNSGVGMYGVYKSEGLLFFQGLAISTIGGGLPVIGQINYWNGFMWYPVPLNLPTNAGYFLSTLPNGSRLYAARTNYATITEAQTILTNDGDAECFVTFFIKGGGRIYQIVNHTNQKGLWFNLSVMDLEEVTIRITRGGVEVTSNTRGSLINYLAPITSFDFNLAVGDNLIGLLMTPTTANAEASAYWSHNYLSVSASGRDNL